MSEPWTHQALWVLADLSVKVAAIVAVAGVSLVLSRARDAALKHAVWALTLVTMLGLVPAALLGDCQASLSVPWLAPSLGVQAPVHGDDMGISARPGGAETRAVAGEAGQPRTSSETRLQAGGRSWASLVLIVYLAGCSLLLARLVLGLVLWRGMVRAAHPLRNGSANRMCGELAAVAGVARPRLLVSARILCPLAVPGRVLLPDRWRSWSPDLLRSVLAHEIAHLRRADPWIQLASELNRALYWFHPAATWLANRIARHAEETCDRLAVQWSGLSRRRYAQHLIEIATPLAGRHQRLLVGGLPMARSSRLGRRIQSLFALPPEPGRGRHRLVWWMVSIALLAAFSFRLAPAAAVGSEGRPPTSNCTPEVLQPMEDSLADGSSWEGQGTALAMLGDARAVGPLARSVSSPRAEDRREAAWNLGMLKSPQAIPALAGALEDGDGEVRASAAWALGMIGRPESVDGLLRSLHDPEPVVRVRAAWALGQIGDRAAVSGLLRCLDDGEVEVRESAARALGMIGDPRAAASLRRRAEDPQEDEAVRARARWALNMIARGRS